MPLDHPPGDAQVDFGEARVIIDGVLQKAHYFCLSLPQSDDMSVTAFPAERIEGLCEGHNLAFAHFSRGVNQGPLNLSGPIQGMRLLGPPLFTATRKSWSRAMSTRWRSSAKARRSSVIPGLTKKRTWFIIPCTI